MCRDNLYKHIIWVDDFDNMNHSLDNMPKDDDEFDSDEVKADNLHENDISIVFGEKYARHVNLFMDLKKVLEYIDKHLNECDCIILDVNLKQMLDPEKEKLFKHLCEVKGVITGSDLRKCGGYYIYLYLLKSGFPTRNICMFTGNKGENNSTEQWENKFRAAGICPPESIVRTDSKKLRDWIENLFLNEYYKTRLLVYKACEYWKGELKNTESIEIEFNKLYYPSHSGYLIKAENFIDMLDRIEKLFPIIEPLECWPIYYQALQVLTMYHEESAKIDILDKKKYSRIKRYHQAVRNFRNWSAHNQFPDNKINADLFIFIFCITLRTYFLNVENQYDIECNTKNLEIYDEYEKEYIKSIIDKSFDFDRFQKSYKEEFSRHLDKVINFGDKKNNCWACKDMNSLLLSSGRCRNSDINKMSFTDLLLNIIDNLITQEDKKEDDFNVVEEGNGDLPRFKLTCNYTWTIDNRNINLAEFKNSDPFKAIAYILFAQKKVSD